MVETKLFQIVTAPDAASQNRTDQREAGLMGKPQSMIVGQTLRRWDPVSGCQNRCDTRRLVGNENAGRAAYEVCMCVCVHEEFVVCAI
jgi:hypothetical protein